MIVLVSKGRGHIAVVGISLFMFVIGAVQITLAQSVAPSRSGDYAEFEDPVGDACARRTDSGVGAPFDPRAHRLIDLQEIQLGSWVPDDPVFNLFDGDFGSSGAHFLRLDLEVEGLVNPPGIVFDEIAFDPFEFGDHPIYGFVEIDMDLDVQTGGELAAPEYRYLGNVGRFGGLPLRQDLHDRVALDSGAFDFDMSTPPFVDRLGEEFHLALLGEEFNRSGIQEISGNGDLVFDAGETWQVTGTFFHRAHGFEEFSLAAGGAVPGEYVPFCILQFRHDVADDTTYISLVFPLTNVGAALMSGEAAQPFNADASDQASVLEALDDLQFSALFLRMFPSGQPEENIILGWADHEPGEFLEPRDWAVTALLGSSYLEYSESNLAFVWSDVFPDVIRGDVNGDGERSEYDKVRILEFIGLEDGSDGALDGKTDVGDFALGFSVYDVDYNGVVDHSDWLFAGGGEAGTSLVDFARLQRCFSEPAAAMLECTQLDLNCDGAIDLDDYQLFMESFSGPEDQGFRR